MFWRDYLLYKLLQCTAGPMPSREGITTSTYLLTYLLTIITGPVPLRTDVPFTNPVSVLQWRWTLQVVARWDWMACPTSTLKRDGNVFSAFRSTRHIILTIYRWRCYRSCRCGCESSTFDRHVLAVKTVVWAPAIVRTPVYVSFRSTTVHIVQPDVSYSSAVSVA